MSYCDFNPRLFKEFTSMKKKIQPAMADDWEIVPESYNTNSGFSLKSKKLNQQVADIELRRFLRFSKEQNLTIQGLSLIGNFIVGNDRSVYTEEMYNKWKEKFEQRTETIIDPKDYQVGHYYSTPCGSKSVYLGERYIVTLKEKSLKENVLTDMTKCVKVRYSINKENINTVLKGKDTYSFYYPFQFKQKYNKDLGKVLEKEDCDKLLQMLSDESTHMVYMGESKPEKDAKLVLKEIPRKNGTSTDFVLARYGNTLIRSDRSYGSCNISSNGSVWAYDHYFKFDEDLKLIKKEEIRRSWNSNDNNYLKVAEIYKLQLI